ncbi:HlyD family efflux transporter periplasmic adaptor subunit [Fulvivirga sp. RKSG066]|uniref:efflux RND transporter periplasmic adaptor subunit n=1 Tax=Fulvivirga aurantia TaxID=2529383 RepID=UPI0012BCE969|nr:efflux RND transporter periplasmic adaptor subunit [Fulvivirga aurantia]MTI21233.1 HlyD family efflux transporter periplasmic adaptor subunit [Fulvivirga aurantia]
MNKKVVIAIGVVAVVVIGFFIVKGNKAADGNEITVKAEKGLFEVRINTTGELEAKSSVKIMGPSGLRNFRIYNVNIQSIAEEGKNVKKGDWIATLDPSELTNKISDAQTELDQKQSQYTQTKLDTTLQMRQARDELINLEYAVEERKIVLEQSKFEPPATIKQAEIDLEKAKRAYTQAKENYKIKHEQNKAKMMEVSAALGKARREFDAMMELRSSFNIKAPESGMLIYRKGWDGRPMKEGSQISAWDPVVATLPDLSVMLSKTYVNEVDVRKIKTGQPVEIGLDAFPEKKLTGKVISVANVGEQRPNSDAKVFQVDVQVDGSDPLLKPSMTTSNAIIAQTLEDVVHIPLECLHSQNDSITYVFVKNGMKVSKQEVLVGATNTDEAVIESGVDDGTQLYLSIPDGMNDAEVALLPELDGKRNKEEEVEQVAAEESDLSKRKRGAGGRMKTQK